MIDSNRPVTPTSSQPTPPNVDERLNEQMVVLDPSSGFERAVAAMVTTYRRKRADYAKDTESWSNFHDMGRFAGVEPWVAALLLCQQKLSRVSALRGNGRPPENESMLDTLLDNANYAVIALAIASEQ